MLMKLTPVGAHREQPIIGISQFKLQRIFLQVSSDSEGTLRI